MYNIENKSILVTGGAGFIGSHVVEELLREHPKRIFIIDNLIRGNLSNMSFFINNPVVEFIKGDVRDSKVVEKYVKESDYIFHMAALRINACAADPTEGFNVMVNATFNLVNLARLYKVKKLIYSSSASVYGMATHFPTPETDHPYDNQTFYGAAKLWGEQLLRSYKFTYGLDYVALRYFNVFGPRMDTDGKYTEVIIRWLDCLRDGKSPLIFGDGSTTMDFISVQDVARANLLALKSDATDEVFNIGTSTETSLKELLAALLKVNNSNLIPEFRPNNIINPVERRLANISKAETLLGFRPSLTLEDGLKNLSAWYFGLQKYQIK